MLHVATTEEEPDRRHKIPQVSVGKDIFYVISSIIFHANLFPCVLFINRHTMKIEKSKIVSKLTEDDMV